MTYKISLFTCALVTLAVVCAASKLPPVECVELARANGVKQHAASLFGLVKKTSRQGIDLAANLLASVPFGTVAVAAGALLGLFFLFLRLLIVLGPILVLGALTRESSSGGYLDFLSMLLEFYNQLIESLDNQTPGSRIGAELGST